MRTNRTLQRLRQGQVAVAPLLVYETPDLVEQVAHLGFDGVFIDGQHGGWTETSLQQVLGRFLATDCTPIVRVRGSDPTAINFALDMGALGVVVPMVQTADEALRCVQGAYYPPRGRRSGGGSRLPLVGGAGYADYFSGANDQVVLVVMLESELAVSNAAAIAQTPGIDVLLVGPGDLAIDVRARGGDEARVEELVQQVASAAQRAGIAAGYVCSTPEVAERRIAQGFQWLVYGSDWGIVDAGFRALRQQSQAW